MTTKKKFNGFKAFIVSLNFIVWTILFTAGTYFSKAQPQKQTVLDMKYDKQIRDAWIMEYINLSLWLFVIAAILCIVGLIINIGFMSNKQNKISKGLLIGFFLSLSCASAYIFYLL
jgi:hypothetical protein